MILRDDTLRPLPRSALVVLGLVLLGVPLLPGWAEPPRNRATGPEDAGPTAPALHRSAPRTPFSSESLPVGTQTGNAASVEDLRDEIEVMRAQVAQAEADLKGKAAYLEYRNKQYERMQQLVQRGAVEERLADQERDRRDAAQAARDAAEGQVNVQRTKLKLAERRLERHQGQPGQGAQELRDTVELLEAQVQVRQAELKAADAALQAASREVKRLKVMAAQGVVDARVLENQQARQETCQAELEVKKASLLEPIIRLKQARRRLEKLEPGKKGTTDRKGPDTTSMKPKGPGQEKETKPGTSSTTAPSRSDKGQAERMQELEKKLKEVTEELNALRRDLGGSKTPPRRAGK